MTISKRKLIAWRREALKSQKLNTDTINVYADSAPNLANAYNKANERILQLTQELIDQKLIEE